MHILIYSVLISTIVCIFWWVLFKKLWILDKPWKYKDLKRKTPVPRLMGIFLILAMILSILIILPGYFITYKEVIYLLAGGIFLAIVAIIDDIWEINPLFRLIVQILVSIIWILWWAVLTHFSFMGNIIEIPYWLWVILSVIWFVLIINAFNWFDGINWMWAGLATIGFFTIALLIKFVIFKYYNVSAWEYKHLILILNLSLIMTGVSFVFTILEIKPWGLLRDVGIMFLAYVLAYLSLLSGAKLGVLFVVLSLVIFDAFWVIINRLKNKKNPMKWDYTHLHHRLMKHGWTRAEIRSFVWIWSVFFMIIIILQGVNTFNKVVILLLIAFIFFWVHIYLYWVKKLPQGLWDRK
jgi:UDP-GlcNAc:undecaprenyl-phosphate GlcNAc-1-phosphate transferase